MNTANKKSTKKAPGRTFVIANILLALVTAGILWVLLTQGGLNTDSSSAALSTQGLSETDRKEIADLQTQIALEQARAEQTREQMRARQLEAQLQAEKSRADKLAKAQSGEENPTIKTLNMDIEREKQRIKEMIAAQAKGIEDNKRLAATLAQKNQELVAVKQQNVALSRQIEAIGNNAQNLMSELTSQKISSEDQSYIDILQGRGKKPEPSNLNQSDLINRIEIADNTALRSTVESLMEKDKPADSFNVAVVSPTTSQINTDSADNLQARIDALLAQSDDRAAKKQLATDAAYLDSLTPLAAERSNETRFITVVRGDTLSLIAQRAYGDPLEYPRIFRANPQVLSNPDRISPGQRLRVPL